MIFIAKTTVNLIKTALSTEYLNLVNANSKEEAFYKVNEYYEKMFKPGHDEAQMNVVINIQISDTIGESIQ